MSADLAGSRELSERLDRGEVKRVVGDAVGRIVQAFEWTRYQSREPIVIRNRRSRYWLAQLTFTSSRCWISAILDEETVLEMADIYRVGP